nr:Hsp70 family protein [Glycomyces amatae]
MLGDREYEVVEVVAAILRRVGDECERIAGTPERTTVTVPAAWGPTRSQVVRDAAERAGLASVALVPEPVAAATFYASLLDQGVAVDSSVVVFDLGAGTFDAGVVARRADGFAVLAVDGRDDLGGLDLDAAVLGRLGRQFAAEPNWRRLLEPESGADRAARRELLEEIRFAKERLSRHQSADLHVPGRDADIHLTRPELEQAAAPLIGQAVKVVKAVIRAAGLTPDLVAGMFLVGGGSRMPIVATALHRELGIAPTTVEQPETAVAQGSVLTERTRPASPATASETPPPQPYAPVPVTLPRPQRLPKPSRTALDRRRRRNRVLAAASSLILIGSITVVTLIWDGIQASGTGADFDSGICAAFDYGPYLELAGVDAADFSSEEVDVTDYDGYVACNYSAEGRSLQFSVMEYDEVGSAVYNVESVVEDPDLEAGVAVGEFTELGDTGYHRVEAGPPVKHWIAFVEGRVVFQVIIGDDSETAEPEAIDAMLVEIGRTLLEDVTGNG